MTRDGFDDFSESLWMERLTYLRFYCIGWDNRLFVALIGPLNIWSCLWLIIDFDLINPKILLSQVCWLTNDVRDVLFEFHLKFWITASIGIPEHTKCKRSCWEDEGDNLYISELSLILLNNWKSFSFWSIYLQKIYFILTIFVLFLILPFTKILLKLFI